ncbi:MAG: tRNA-dihydrouridine synthase [Candidatus Paceibacterota bacterium]|jgi:nifR3 family TIM-barrel protein
MKSFWEKLPKPFFCLAPMADVTDSAFRRIICKYGKPDVFWTEFVSADGLANEKGRKKLLINLKFSKNEHPIVAQIFGANPENIKYASALCAKLGFDGIDINMGCPDRAIEKQGAGAKMMQNQKLAGEIIESAKVGAKGLSVSVKTRIGYNKDEIDTWVSFLLEQNLSALTVHLRTRKEMSLVPAHWELAKKIVTLRNKINKKTLIIFNGDVVSIEDGIKKARMCGCDGAMIGRGIFGNPWLFANKIPSIKQKLKVLIEHTKLFEKELGKHKSFAVMKKHFKAYVNGFDGAKELRIKLMETENAKEVEKIIKEFLKRKGK